MNEIKKISNSFGQTLKDSNLQNVSIGITETLSDSMLPDGLLKDIPVIGTIVGLGKASMSIRNSLFIKKIIHFLSEIEYVPIEKRKEMINSIDTDVNQKIKVGEKLIYILDKSDDYISAQYIGQLFSAFLQEKIDYKEFLRCSRIVQNVLTEDLEYFLNCDLNQFEGDSAVSEDGLYDYINPLINVEICSINLKKVKVEENFWDESSDRYDVSGGELEIQVTNIGFKLKNILKVIN